MNTTTLRDWNKDIEIIITPLEDTESDGRDLIIFKEKLFRLIDNLFHTRERELIEDIEGMNEQNEITQAILAALEYRGFNDAGKYLDGDIWERIKPLIINLINGKRNGDANQS